MLIQAVLLNAYIASSICKCPQCCSALAGVLHVVWTPSEKHNFANASRGLQRYRKAECWKCAWRHDTCSWSGQTCLLSGLGRQRFCGNECFRVCIPTLLQLWQQSGSNFSLIAHVKACDWMQTRVMMNSLACWGLEPLELRDTELAFDCTCVNMSDCTQMWAKWGDWCYRTETAEFNKDDLYVARYEPIETLLKEGWVHLI